MRHALSQLWAMVAQTINMLSTFISAGEDIAHMCKDTTGQIRAEMQLENEAALKLLEQTPPNEEK